ncbi:MAG: DUF192 domain-containing protein [Bdellovibrionales bacterium]|nr:DUF192 domain-containing protein [Bdellovibrionales bacterium]
MENRKVYKLQTKAGLTICEKMVVAGDSLSRMKGLMFSEELPDCDGLLLNPGNSIHTFFMRYSLDVLFLDKKFKVVKVIRDLRPWKLTWIYFRSRQVLEMKSGSLNKEIKAGDELEAICIN